MSDDVPKGGFTQELIFDHLTEAGLSWSMYYEDSLAVRSHARLCYQAVHTRV